MAGPMMRVAWGRRLRHEMGSLGMFRSESGVEPANNRAECALNFGVLWRKGSLGAASSKGNDCDVGVSVTEATEFLGAG